MLLKCFDKNFDVCVALCADGTSNVGFVYHRTIRIRIFSVISGMKTTQQRQEIALKCIIFRM